MKECINFDFDLILSHYYFSLLRISYHVCHLICHKCPVCFLSFSQSGRTEILGSVAECYGEPPPLSGLSRPSGPNVPPSLNRPIYHPPYIFATSIPSHCEREIRVGSRQSRFESRVEKRERLLVSRRLLIQVLFPPQLSCLFFTKLSLRQHLLPVCN